MNQSDPSDLRGTPVITAYVNGAMRHQSNQTIGERSFQIDMLLQNHSRCPANIEYAWAVLCLRGSAILCHADRGFCLAPQTGTHEIHFDSMPWQLPAGEAALVCLTLSVEQEGEDRHLIPRFRSGTVELIDHREDKAAGQRWLLKTPIGHNVGPVTLLYPSKTSWLARDDRGDELEILSNWLLPTGMVPLGEYLA